MFRNPLEERGGGLQRAQYIFLKKSSLRALRAHYITPASSGVPNKGDKSKRAQKRAEMLHHPCILGDPQTNGDKIRNGCLNPAYWGAHKWAEMLRHPCFLGDPQQRGQNQSTKKTKKNKNKQFPMVSLILPMVL